MRARTRVFRPQLNRPDDPFEVAADRMAARALNGPTPPQQRLSPLHGAARPSGVESHGQPLDLATRVAMEARFGHDFSQVRVHADEHAAASARASGTLAHTLGRDIVFGAGAYAPGTTAGRTLLAHELAHVVQQQGALGAGGMGAQRPPAGVAQGRHLTIPEAVQTFASKVDAVQPEAAAHGPEPPSIVESGQFYWSTQLDQLVRHDYRTTLNDPSWDPDERARLLAALDLAVNSIFSYDAKKWQHFTAASNLIKHSKNPLKSRLLPLFYDAAHLSGAELDAKLWRYRNTKDLIPELRPYRSLLVLNRLHDAEAIACGKAANLVTSRFLSHGGFSDEDPDKQRDVKGLKGKSYSIASGITRSDNEEKQGALTFYWGDEVHYGGSLGSALADVKRALDAGFVVKARVVSGVGVTGPVRLHTEHSIVIIGYDKDLFVFWDPDSQQSTMPQAGFGYLFNSGKRFGTAGGDESFRVDADGNHAGGGQHRYQIVTLTIA
jgi:hypothetical protein